MELNKVIFPAPPSSYEATHPSLIFIPRNEKSYQQSNTNHNGVKVQILEEDDQDCQQQSTSNRKVDIPCWLEKCESDKLIVFFHGNAEDIGISYEFIRIMTQYLKMNVLAIEYPGYGVYKDEKSSEQILTDAEIVYRYLTRTIQIQPKNIILFGRSIGSGPATHLATYDCAGLILMSGYVSIKEIVKDFTGGSLLQHFIKDHFNNQEKIRNTKCPILLIHGQKDDLIKSKHSEMLKQIATKGDNQQVELQLRPNMTHNDFHLFNDFINIVQDFFEKYNIIVEKDQKQIGDLKNKQDQIVSYKEEDHKKDKDRVVNLL